MRKTILAFALMAFAVLPSVIKAQTAASEGRGVDVVGTAQKVLTPDKVIIQIAVENRAKSAKGAQEATSQSVAKVLAYLKSKDNIKSVETNYVSLRPQRIDYNREEYEYIAMQQIAFELNNIGDYQNVIIDLLDRGVNGIGQVMFESSQRKEAERKLLADAVRNAREKAEFLAAQLNQEVGKAIYISDRIQSAGPTPVYFRDALKVESQAVIAPGELKVSAEVNVTFQLK